MAYRRTAISTFPRAVLAMSVISLTFLLAARLFRGVYSPTAPAVPSLRSLVPSGFLIGSRRMTILLRLVRSKVPGVLNGHTILSPKLLVASSFVSEGTDSSKMSSSSFFSNPGGRSGFSLHDLQYDGLPIDPVDVPSLPRRGCYLKSRFLMPLLPSVFARRLLPNVRPFEVPCTASSLTCPWRQCPLLGAGMAQRDMPLRAATNFFRDPPSPWVRF
jgi:hypothetical protein